VHSGLSKLKLNRIHHVSIICSDYEKSKFFYTGILGLKIIREIYREERRSYKLDLSLNGEYAIELFSFPDPPERLTLPEAAGLRHPAFEVDNLNEVIEILNKKNVISEPVRVDETTGKKFTFIFDPDNLPIELYEK
jgi:glyoxylase I family protein